MHVPCYYDNLITLFILSFVIIVYRNYFNKYLHDIFTKYDENYNNMLLQHYKYLDLNNNKYLLKQKYLNNIEKKIKDYTANLEVINNNNIDNIKNIISIYVSFNNAILYCLFYVFVVQYLNDFLVINYENIYSLIFD